MPSLGGTVYSLYGDRLAILHQTNLGTRARYGKGLCWLKQIALNRRCLKVTCVYTRKDSVGSCTSRVGFPSACCDSGQPEIKMVVMHDCLGMSLEQPRLLLTDCPRREETSRNTDVLPGGKESNHTFLSFFHNL